MNQRLSSWVSVGSLALLAQLGCEDLRLVDRLDENGSTSTPAGGASAISGTASSGNGGTKSNSSTGGLTAAASAGATLTSAGWGGNGAEAGGSAGGTTAVVHSFGANGGLTSETAGGTGQGGVSNTEGGTHSIVAGGGSPAEGGVANGGSAQGGATSTHAGGTHASGTNSGGTHPDRTSTAGQSTNAAGAPTAGGTSSGGTSSGGSASGGSSSGGTSSGGTSSGGSASGGTNSGGSVVVHATAGTGSTNGATVCPFPISKSKALRAAEPVPSDPCARVSNVVLHRTGYFAFGYTNGEIYVLDVQGTPLRQQTVHTWMQSGVTYRLPAGIVTAMVSPRINFEGPLQVAYADPWETNYKPWWSTRAGWSWLEATVEYMGPAMSMTSCPFHGGGLSHIELSTPWLTQGSLDGGRTYLGANAGKLNQHLRLSGSYQVTAIEYVTRADGWLVYVGTGDGEIYVSSLFNTSVTWNEATETLNAPVSWTKITGPEMPKRWITRLAVHPNHPERIFAVFATNEQNAVWYSGDGGQSWANRHGNLPTTYNTINKAPPVLGVSFNPLVDDAAYAVTSLTAYHTEDAGMTWSEW